LKRLASVFGQEHDVVAAFQDVNHQGPVHSVILRQKNPEILWRRNCNGGANLAVKWKALATTLLQTFQPDGNDLFISIKAVHRQRCLYRRGERPGRALPVAPQCR
jgi:hypothetical protein